MSVGDFASPVFRLIAAAEGSYRACLIERLARALSAESESGKIEKLLKIIEAERARAYDDSERIG